MARQIRHATKLGHASHADRWTLLRRIYTPRRESRHAITIDISLRTPIEL